MRLVWRGSVVLLLGLVGAFSLVGPAPSQAQGGPTVKVTAPANGSSVSNPVTVTVQTSGAAIKDASANDPNAAHLHYFIDRDPATVLQPGQPIPTGQPDIIHTPNTSEQLPTLAAGAHTVWVVLAHTDHTPYSPNVQDQVRFVVGASAQTPAAGAGAAPPQMPVTGRGGLLPSATPAGPLPSVIAALVRGNDIKDVSLGVAALALMMVAGLAWSRRRDAAGRG